MPAIGSSSSRSRGCGDQRARQLDALLQAVGQRADEASRRRRDRRKVDDRGRRARALARLRAGRAAGPATCSTKLERAWRRRARSTTLSSTVKPWKQRQVLEGARDAERAPAAGVGTRANELAADGDRAAVGPVDAADEVDQRALAGAVRADDRADLAARDREVDIGERGDAAERQRHAHAGSARLRQQRRCRRSKRAAADAGRCGRAARYAGKGDAPATAPA